MAKVRFNALVDGMTGRMGGLIFQRWRSIHYVRTYTPPRDARSQEQLLLRGRFRTLVHAWRSLDTAARAAWNNAAAGMNMSGYNLFISTNMKRSRFEAVSPSFPSRPRSYPPVPSRSVPIFPTSRRVTVDPSVSSERIRRIPIDLHRNIPRIRRYLASG